MDPGVPHILLNSIILQVAVAPMHLHSLVTDLLGDREEMSLVPASLWSTWLPSPLRTSVWQSAINGREYERGPGEAPDSKWSDTKAILLLNQSNKAQTSTFLLQAVLEAKLPTTPRTD